MLRKYEFTGETKKVFGRTLKQIRAVAAIDSLGVASGDIGGWIEAESNLSHEGNAWVSGNARVFGNAWVHGDAQVYGNARVSGNADCIWFSKVGSENGTLTACKSIGGIWVSRGCFSGAIDEFERAVKKTHADNQTAKEYALLIEFIKLRMGGSDA